MKIRGDGESNCHPCLLRSIINSSSSSRSGNLYYSSTCHQYKAVNTLGNNNYQSHATKYLGTPNKKNNLIYSLMFIILFYFMIHYVSCQFYNAPTNLQYFSSPTTARRWIITGNFTTITVNNMTTTYKNLNNIAVWNGNTWKALGAGTNGLVRTQFVDTCYNLYVGGDFSTAGNLTTGPIARWSISKQRWESITDNVVWSKDSKVTSVSVDCFNTPSEISRCQCNVWVGGNFELTIANSTQNATNIAMYEAFTNKWYSLKDTNGHNLTLANNVLTVFKRDFGQTFNSRKTFIGGDFPYILTWDPYYKIWETIGMGNLTNQVVVNHIHFHKGILSTDLFDYWNYVVAGEYSFTVNYTDQNVTVSCQNLCLLDFRSGIWSPALSDPVLIGSVRHVSTSDGNLCAVGNFSTDGIFDLVSITSSGIDYTKFNTTLSEQPFSSIYVCKEIDFECAIGSAGLADDNGVISFFDVETSTFTEFGRVNDGGVVTAINSVYLYNIADKM